MAIEEAGMSTLPKSVDRMPVELRKPRAGPILDPDEVIASGLNYAMQFEFWKRPITPNSQVVLAVMEAIRLSDYEIVPKGRKL